MDFGRTLDLDNWQSRSLWLIFNNCGVSVCVSSKPHRLIIAVKRDLERATIRGREGHVCPGRKSDALALQIHWAVVVIPNSCGFRPHRVHKYVRVDCSTVQALDEGCATRKHVDSRWAKRSAWGYLNVAGDPLDAREITKEECWAPFCYFGGLRDQILGQQT